ncbi:MAG: amidase [Gemmatimonadaceae bacterium]|nr:amidase [Gemmatimonadaceae bacterium]
MASDGIDPAWLDATAQAALVRAGEVTPLELVDAAIARVEELNPALNAVVTPLFDSAREAAEGPLPEGPLKGVPYLLKDLGAAQAGVRRTSGASVLGDFAPDVDDVLVERLRAAGLVFIGRTNTPELGASATTEPSLFGPTRNPWDPRRSPGGSSGGSAAAVASGMVPAAHGNDGGGSIRIPASCCGLFGLKPTRARATTAPGAGDQGLSVNHALTRSVRDSAVLLDAIAGGVSGDPWWAPPPRRPYAEEVGADPGRLRIAWTAAAPRGSAVHPDCVRAVEETAALCRDLGHEVEEGSPEFDYPPFEEAFIAMFAAGVAASLDGIQRQFGVAPSPAKYDPPTWRLYERGADLSASRYLQAVELTQGVGRRLAAFFEETDIWLTPTLGRPPELLGRLEPSLETDPDEALEYVLSFVAFTPICNCAGGPAASVPLHWNEEGLPIGVQIAAPYGGEDVLFRLASQLEAARPWAGRRPPVSA